MYRVAVYDTIGGGTPVILFKAVVEGWSKRINAPGQMAFSLPNDDPDATDTNLQKYKRVKLFRQKRDGTDSYEVVWSGYIESTVREAEVIHVGCQGMLQFFAKRYTTDSQEFTAAGSTAAFALLTTTNADPTGIVTGTGGVTNAKDVKMQGMVTILDAWTQLAQADTAEFEIDDTGTFNFVTALGTDKSSSVTFLFYRQGTPGSNVTDVQIGEDGAPMANRVIGYTTTPVALTSTKDDATSQAKYGVLVLNKQFNEAQDQTTLDAMTQAYLTQVANPITDFQCLPILAQRVMDMVTGAPKITGLQYGDVVLGDLVTVNIFTENQTISSAQKRIAEIVVNVDQNANEEVRYTFSATGVFVTAASLAVAEFPDIQTRVAKLESQVGTGGGGGGGGGSSPTYYDNETPSGSINSSNVTFTLAHTPVAGSEHVYLDGVLQNPGGNDYTASAGTLTFVNAPLTGEGLLVSYRTSSGTTNFADKETPSGSINGANVTFTLAHTPVAGSEHVWLDGILQNPGGNDYSISSGTITCVSAPQSGMTLLVSYRY